jgi:hypothetical protein
MLSWNTSHQEEETKGVLWREFWMDEGGRNRPGGLTPWQHYDDDTYVFTSFHLFNFYL